MSQMMPEGGMPPEIMAMMQGGGAPPMEQPAQDDSPQGAFDRVMAEVQKLVEADGQVTQSEAMELEKIRMSIRKILAGREKEEQAALGGGPATSYLKRAVGG